MRTYLWMKDCRLWVDIAGQTSFVLDGNARKKFASFQNAQFFRFVTTSDTSWHDMHLTLNEALWSMSACLTFYNGSAPLWLVLTSVWSCVCYCSPFHHLPALSLLGFRRCTPEKNTASGNHQIMLIVAMQCVWAGNLWEKRAGKPLISWIAQFTNRDWWHCERRQWEVLPRSERIKT